jgi:hypothetical protein
MSEIIEKKENIFKPSIHRHESFILRKGWLHKGIRNVKKDERLFTRTAGDESKACDVLGIGVNMVKALRYWLNATRVIYEDKKKQQYVSDIGKIIDENDPYFEERGTNYAIHYLLASNRNDATAWWWFFNEHKGATIDKRQFVEDFSEYCRIHGDGETVAAQRVLESEFNTLIRTYYGREDNDENTDPEETKICPLTELRLVTIGDIKRRQDGTEKEYKKIMPDKDDIHPWIAYAVICDRQKTLGTDEIQINELLNGDSNIGKIFNLDRSTIFYLIEKIERLGLIKITRTAGLDIIRMKKSMIFEKCLEAYYKTLSGEEQND